MHLGGGAVPDFGVVRNSNAAHGRWSGSLFVCGFQLYCCSWEMERFLILVWFEAAMLLMGGGAIPNLCKGFEQYRCFWEVERFPFLVGF